MSFKSTYKKTEKECNNLDYRKIPLKYLKSLKKRAYIHMKELNISDEKSVIEAYDNDLDGFFKFTKKEEKLIFLNSIIRSLKNELKRREKKEG